MHTYIHTCLRVTSEALLSYFGIDSRTLIMAEYHDETKPDHGPPKAEPKPQTLNQKPGKSPKTTLNRSLHPNP